MRLKHRVIVLVGLALLAGCDDDPTAPASSFRRLDCATSRVGINNPIGIGFSGRVAPASVAPGNVVVANAATGVEIPGSLSTNAARSGDSIYFRSSTPLPFDTPLRIRVQNIAAASGGEALDLAVCDVRTALPEITEVRWTQLATAPGPLIGASLIGPDSGFVLANQGPVYLTSGSQFAVAAEFPHYETGADVAFINAQKGFIALYDPHTGNTDLLRSTTGGATGQVLFSTGSLVTRVVALPAGNDMFAVAGGGGVSGLTAFLKYRPATNTFVEQDIATTGANTAGTVTDIDFVPGDTTFGAAASVGLGGGLADSRGMLWVTTNGGATWDSIPGSRASAQTVTYNAVGVRLHGQEVFVGGGNATLRRFTRTAGLAYTVTEYPRSTFAGLSATVSTNPNDVTINDVEFNPANDQQGWLIGGQLVGFVNGVPQYQGFIYETRDGGRTWIRQGIRGRSPTFNAPVPNLFRISIGPGTSAAAPRVWIVGDQGLVLTYRP